LHDLIRIFLVPRDAISEREQTAAMPLDQEPVRILVALEDLGDEDCVLWAAGLKLHPDH
jgi:hypothetical protein